MYTPNDPSQPSTDPATSSADAPPPPPPASLASYLPLDPLAPAYIPRPSSPNDPSNTPTRAAVRIIEQYWSHQSDIISSGAARRAWYAPLRALVFFPYAMRQIMCIANAQEAPRRGPTDVLGPSSTCPPAPSDKTLAELDKRWRNYHWARTGVLCPAFFSSDVDVDVDSDRPPTEEWLDDTPDEIDDSPLKPDETAFTSKRDANGAFRHERLGVYWKGLAEAHGTAGLRPWYQGIPLVPYMLYLATRLPRPGNTMRDHDRILGNLHWAYCGRVEKGYFEREEADAPGRDLEVGDVEKQPLL